MKKKKKKYVVVNRKRLISAITICTIIIIGGSISIVKYVKSVNKENTISYSKKITANKKVDYKDKQQGNINESIEEADNKNKIATQNANDEPSDKKVTTENFLSTAAFLGDSITEGFSFYSIVDSNRVLAKKGDTTVKAMEYISSVKELQPQSIFILYGMNDLVNFENDNDFIKSYSNLIDSIKKEIPNAQIYIQSVLPIATFAEDASLNLTNARIDTVNEMLLNMCTDKSLNYINIGKGLKQNESLFEPDGKHVKADFYNIWIEEIKNNL